MIKCLNSARKMLRKIGQTRTVFIGFKYTDKKFFRATVFFRLTDENHPNKHPDDEERKVKFFQVSRDCLLAVR